MSDITANVVVSMPSQLFTMARQFKAAAHGKIYIGLIDTDPVNPANRIQVYLENEDGSHVPVPQPIIINAGGYPVYNGQIAKFVTVQGHSMAVYDAFGTQQFYYPNVLKYDPDQFRNELLEGPITERGAGLALRDFVTPEDFGAPANGIDNDSPAVQFALNEAIASGKPLLLNGNYCFFTTVEAITSKKVVITGSGIIHHKSGAFKISGVVGPEIDTTVSITDFNATSISLVDASGFNLNDLGIIHSATMCLSEDAGSMQLGIATAGGAPSWFGEFFRINGKTGNIINLTTPLVFNSYRTTPQPNSGARTKTTVKKVTPVRGSISGNLTFLREGNATTAVEINYGDGFAVKGRFYNGKIAGSAVVFKYCYMCEVGPDSYFNIDADTPINFGSVVWPAGSVSAGDYYNFNSVKTISSQMCGCSGALFENTSQTFDITYDQMPSIGCYFKGNKVMFARHNMATSHGGNYANMFDSNLGFACWRGIASRSREDSITNNRIYGFRRFPTNPNTSGDTYGIGLTEGFTIGNTVIGNYISGFLRDVYINAGSSRGPGLDYMRITVESNRMSYCRHHVDIDLSTPSVKGTESGISIAHNQFDSNTRQSLNFGQYLTAVIIRDNVWVDAPSEDFYVINAEGNCKNFDISGNSFKKSTAGVEKYVWMKSITDPDLGPDTVQNANVTFRGNVVRGVLEPDGFVYGTMAPTQVRLPAGNGFDTFQTGVATRITGVTGDYTLDSLTYNNVNFVTTTPFNLLGITGGNNGRDLVLWNTSANNPVTVKNSATVQTRSNADFVLTANTPLHLRYMNNKWREV